MTVPSNIPGKRRHVDFQIIADWIQPGERVLDLGCGRGVLCEYLQRKKGAYTVGVDIDFDKILNCVRRGVPAYQGDILAILETFPEGAFDHVIFSRTVEHLHAPERTLATAARVGKRVTVGFINHAFWLNRLHMFRRGERVRNEVYPKAWHESAPANHFSIREFERFCHGQNLAIHRRYLLAGDWKKETRFLPNLFAGYALYDLGRAEG